MGEKDIALHGHEFSKSDRELVVSLSQRLTGSNPSTQPKIESCLANISRRMHATKSKDLKTYLGLLEFSTEELAHFISSVTIHTTSWFREMPHFDRLTQYVNHNHLKPSFLPSKKSIRVLSAGCSTGEEGYSMSLVLEEIKQRDPAFDYQIDGWDIDPVSVAKANQAIYHANAKREIPPQFYKFLMTGTGKAEGFITLDKPLRMRCSYKRRNLLDPKQKTDGLYDVIFCRNVLIYFNAETVQNIVRNLISFLNPNGLICLGHSESIDAKDLGLEALGNATYKKIQSLQTQAVKETRVVQKTTPSAIDLILVGASTGGTEALMQVLRDMPRPCPPVVVVQHIAHAFAKPFAERLAAGAGLTLGIPMQATPLQQNHLYLPWDDAHLGLKKRGSLYYMEINHGPLIHSVRPSVDFLFNSAARGLDTSNIVAVLLTGMGKDGAAGLSTLKTYGARTLVQDEQSSAVFGMPREAIMLGAAEFVGNLSAIRERLLSLYQERPTTQKPQNKVS